MGIRIKDISTTLSATPIANIASTYLEADHATSGSAKISPQIIIDHANQVGNMTNVAYQGQANSFVGNQDITGTLSTTSTLTTAGVYSQDDTTQSTSSTTGSIHTDGGLGVAKDVFIDGSATIAGGLKNWSNPQKGMIFDGTDDKITVSDDANLNGFTDFSIEIFTTLKELNANDRIIAKGVTGAGNWLVHMTSTNLRVYMKDDDDVATDMTFTGYTLTVDEGIHIILALDYDSQLLNLYINGVFIESKATSTYTGTFTNANDLTIGTDNSGSIFSTQNGYLFRIWNLTLTQSEVTDLYNNGQPQNAEVPSRFRWGSQTSYTSSDLTTWATTNVSVSSGETDADGGSNAYLVTENTANDWHVIKISTPNLPVYNKIKYSYKFKTNGANSLARFYYTTDGAVGYLVFDSTGTLVTSSGTSSFDYTIESLGSSWYKVTITYEVGAVQAVQIGCADGSNVSYTGNGTDGVYYYDVSTLAVGAVASYKGENATQSTWFDESDNALNGTTSGSPQLLNENSKGFYQEGTFTPTYTSTGATPTYTAQVGQYTKIGNLVTFSIYLTTSAMSGTLTNAIYISGLPFTSKNLSNGYHSISIGYIYRIDYPASCLQLMGYIAPNDTKITLSFARDDATNLQATATEFDYSNTGIMITGTYFTDN